MIGARRSSGTISRLKGLAATGAFVLAVSVLTVIQSAQPAAALPAGFSEVQAFGGLANPTAVKFAPDGRVFVAEKRGTVQMFDSLTDTTATQVVDLRTETHSFWDRGFLGLAVDPGFPGRPFIYAMYAFDSQLPGTGTNPGPGAGPMPRWGVAGADSDGCPNPPGATTDGCVVSSKLVKFTLNLANPGTATTTKTDLIHDWCQQFPSHSAGDLVFGNDGALYASGGDGASFDFVDYGQTGYPAKNPCNDPGGITAPTAEGGALRSQDLRTTGDPTSLSGTVIRINPDTGAAAAGNPNIGAADPNAQRIVAYGLRNPFRMGMRPGTNELWISDVGWATTEELNRLVNPTGGMTNFGWPCYEGPVRNTEYDNTNLNICEGLYAANVDTKPYISYPHGGRMNAADNCATANGASASGVTFAKTTGSPYPAEYNGAAFFADYARDCIFVMTLGADGQPSVASARPFVSPARAVVDVEMSPAGELFYVDFTGSIRRIAYAGGTPPPPPPPPPPGGCATGQYTATYFANTTLTGTPAATSCEAGPMLNKDWALAAPATGIPADNWSARFAGSIDFPTAATYTFTAQADDGIRVYIDDTVLIDQWRDQEATFTA
ncbi:hypothetical protein E4P40_25140, partial [Blastococcus sp. CT_GayMR20]|uniref:PQQ-dependent sugar dehydrogenase n=1 Tax=Blastococcus sp. CT_GayMR20 TaxID=2559609 RepID=UPI001102AC93